MELFHIDTAYLIFVENVYENLNIIFRKSDDYLQKLLFFFAFLGSTKNVLT